MKISEITQEQFDAELFRILRGYNGEWFISLPGFYEIVAEHFNNEVLCNIQMDHEETTDERTN